MGRLLRSAATPSTAALNQAASWNDLSLQRVRRHLLAPLAYRAGVEALRKDFVTAALQAERREVLLAEALEVLGPIEAILLKGIAYVGAIYPEPAERPMTDIDLLVREAQFDDAARALRRAGYWHDGKLNQRSAANHAVTFRRQESAIDLHRGLVQRGRMGIDLDAVWRDAVPARHGAFRPAPAHEYLLHIAHMARHQLSVPLIAYVDAVRLRRAIDGVSTSRVSASGLSRATAADLADLALQWRLRRALALVENRVAALSDPSPNRPQPWSPFPDRRELYAGELPPRWLQVARKLAIHDGPRDYVAFAAASVRTRLGV